MMSGKIYRPAIKEDVSPQAFPLGPELTVRLP